jgi:energy-converting hydrogenase B subunit C
MITVIGILRLNDDVDKVVYVRIHLLGIVDIAGVLAMIGLNQPLLACIYFILAPIVAHAMANAYYYGEDDRGYESDLNDGVTDYEISDSEDGYELSKLNMVHED